MSNKDIKIRWISDDTEVERSIQRLQGKMKRMNEVNTKMNEYSQGGGTLSKRAQHAQNQFQKTSGYMLEKESRELEKQQSKESAMLLQKQRELMKIEKIEGNITKEQEKRMDMLKEEINLRSHKIMEMEGAKQDIDSNLKGIRGDGGPPEGGSGGGGANGKAMEMFKNILKSIGVASIINGALNFTQHRLERDRKMLTDTGLTAQMSSRELREQMSGQGSRGLFFAGERQKAMEMASEEQRGQGGLDLAKVIGSTAMGAFGGAVAGSIIPGLGTIAGGIGGGMAAFGGSMATNDKMYNRVFDQEAYKKMLTREGMQKYESNRQMLELQNPLKTAAYDEMQNSLDKNIGLERGLGLGGRDLYGASDSGSMSGSMSSMMNTPQMKDIMGFKRSGRGVSSAVVGQGYDPTGTSPLQGGMKGTDISSMFGGGDFNFAEAGTGVGGRGFLRNSMNPYGTQMGFEREDVDRSVSSLMGAGATTEGARGLAGRGLAFERNLRLGNAQNVMGQMSGAGMSNNETEQATIKLMSEAVKLGVDTSKMPQEMQRMTAITAQLATRGGGFSESAAGTFGAGVTNFSKQGIEGASSAFDEMLGRAKEAGGFEGQMGMGFLMGSGAEGAFGGDAAKKLKGNSKLMNALNQYSAIDLEQDPELAKGLAQKLGISPSELIAGMKKKDEFKQTRTASQQDAASKLGEAMKGMNASEEEAFLGTDEGSALYAQSAIEDIAAFGTKESGKGKFARRAGIVGRGNRLTGNVGGDTGSQEAGLEDQLTNDSGLSQTEAIKSSRATGDMARLEALNKNLDDLTKAARKHTTAAEMYNKHFDTFVKYAAESGDALGKMNVQLKQVVEMLEEEGIAAGEPE